jgi:tetratricopeptide (TPR) repeat protein
MGKKGFGKPTEIPTRNEMKFMRAILDCLAESQRDSTVYQLLQSHLPNLNESFLEALPLIFNKLIADESLRARENIATLFLNFGDLIREFPLGSKMLNLEFSITACNLVLKVFRRETSSYYWAAAQNNLGNAYGDRIQGDRADNLELAINHCNLALQVYTQEAFPKQWAMVHNNLSTIYCDRIRGERANNLEQAIEHCNLALKVRTQKAFSYDWAMTQNNLGRAYLLRIRGDRAGNLEQAINHFKLALQVHTQKYFPEDWAMVQINLGNIYLLQIRGDRANNIEQAINHFKSALQIYTRDASPHDWARSQGGFAGALIERASFISNTSDLDTAIDLLQELLTVLASSDSMFASTYYLLGNAFSRRYEYSQNLSDIEQAFQSYKMALDALTPEHYNRHHFWQSLPDTQVVLGSRLVIDGQWQEGLQLLLNSITQLSTGDDPLAHANALLQTGLAYETLSDWNNARLYYRDAIRLYEDLQDLPGIAKSRAGLGAVLTSQGYVDKGVKELEMARSIYHRLPKSKFSTQAAEVDSLYQSAQQIIEEKSMEIYA